MMMQYRKLTPKQSILLQWNEKILLLSSVKRGGLQKTDMIHPIRKRRWKVMPIGSLNADSMFVAMTMKLKMEWDILTKERGYVLLYGSSTSQLVAYFRTVLDVLKHNRATLELKKVQIVSLQVLVFRDVNDSGWSRTCTVQK